MSTPPQEIIGFVGLGTMGAPMAGNIARGGHEVRLYDADVEIARELATRIAGRAVAEPAELAECTLVVTMLPTSAIVRAVLLDGDVLRIPLRPGSVVVDMSSSDPTDTVETGRALMRSGVHLVDAPVSGARPRAEDATLAIMMGADDEDAAGRASAVVELMSRRIYRTGALGTGHAMKALNNFVAGSAFVATSEALVAGERFGLDPKVMVDVFNDSTGQSFSSLNVFGPHIVDGRYASGFALPLITKDVRIAQELQRFVGHEAPVCDAVTGALEDALGALGDVDHTRAHTFWEAR